MAAGSGSFNDMSVRGNRMHGGAPIGDEKKAGMDPRDNVDSGLIETAHGSDNAGGLKEAAKGNKGPSMHGQSTFLEHDGSHLARIGPPPAQGPRSLPGQADLTRHPLNPPGQSGGGEG